jgi:SAM-dependent methyltransferase
MVRRGWDALAAWRDLRMGESGDLWHRAIIDPSLLRVVGRVRGLRVLDLGCGNGYLTRRWARAGAASSVGVDASAATLAFALRREKACPSGAVFLRRNASHLTGLPDGSVDLVVANMALMDLRDAAGAVREVGRILSEDGRFVFSICHPCFDLDDRSMWVTERHLFEDTVWRKVRAYRDERVSQARWKLSESEMGTTPTYHRTLSTYQRYLRDAGLATLRIEEPLPQRAAVEQSPQGKFMLEVPLHLVIEAAPWGRTRRPARASRSVSAPASRRSGRTPRKAAPRSGSRGHRPGSDSARRGSTTGS